MADINVGVITESLNYKLDLDLGNTSLIQVVDALPETPNKDTFYFIPEKE